MTPLVAVQVTLPDSKPGLPSFWPGLPQPPAGLMTQLKLVLPLWLAVSVAVTFGV